MQPSWISKNIRIIENTVRDTGTIAGMGLSNNQNDLGMYINGENALISGNQVFRSGYIGINYHGNRNLVTNNFVDQYDLTMDDGGGIYGLGTIGKLCTTYPGGEWSVLR